MPEPRKPAILIVSYLFPPAGGISVQRALSLAKYLPENGFEVHVLHAHNASAPVSDPDLLKQVPGCVRVHGAFAPEVPFALRQKVWNRLKRAASASGESGNCGVSEKPAWWKKAAKAMAQRLFSPEPEIWWVPFAIREGSRIIRRHRIDFVLVTVPPFSALVAGVELKRRFPAIRLISDFRDEWLKFYLGDFDFQDNARTRRRAEQIERDSVYASDLVVAVTDSSLAEIRSRYPEVHAEKFAVIHNGYDPATFAKFESRPRPASDRIIVTHAGTAYKTASPRYYLDALDGMPPDLRNRFETRFVGRISESEREVIGDRASTVRALGFLPQAEAVRMIEETDVLLLTMTDRISLPGKLFEYLASGKPILAITPDDSEVARILRETKAGWTAPPDDPASIRTALLKAISFSRGETPFAPDREAIRRYERPALTREYAGALRALGRKRPDSRSGAEVAKPALAGKPVALLAGNRRNNEVTST